MLVLSQFTGAARELKDAVQVNPFDVERLADALFTALTMPADEQRRRMRRMRQQVDDHNIYRWAGKLLAEVGKLAGEVGDVTPEPDEHEADSDTGWYALPRPNGHFSLAAR